MKKYLLYIIGLLLIVYPLFALYGLMGEWDGSGLAYMFAINMLAFVIAGIGLFMKKNWAIILYWIAAIMTFIGVISSGRNLLVLDFDTIFFIIEIVIGIFLLMQWNKLGAREDSQNFQSNSTY